jgi:hypothetical protein
MGKKQMDVAINWDLGFEKSVSGLDKYFAKAKLAKILHVSTGCRFMNPRGIQLLDPFTVFPIAKVASMSSIPIAYSKLGVAVKNLLSVNNMKVAITAQMMR